jgi:hypothetical protein
MFAVHIYKTLSPSPPQETGILVQQFPSLILPSRLLPGARLFILYKCRKKQKTEINLNHQIRPDDLISEKQSNQTKGT